MIIYLKSFLGRFLVEIRNRQRMIAEVNVLNKGQVRKMKMGQKIYKNTDKEISFKNFLYFTSPNLVLCTCIYQSDLFIDFALLEQAQDQGQCHLMSLYPAGALVACLKTMSVGGVCRQYSLWFGCLGSDQFQLIVFFSLFSVCNVLQLDLPIIIMPKQHRNVME